MTSGKPQFPPEYGGDNPQGDDPSAETQATGANATRHLPRAAPPQPPPRRGRPPRSEPRPPQAVPRQPPSVPSPTPQQRSRSSHRGRARARRDSGLYLPVWSLALMLFVVMAAVVGIVLLVIALGGKEAPPTDMIVVIYSPVPTTRPDSFPLSPATPTLPPAANDLLNRPPVTFELSGPTLQPFVMSPTPLRIAVGGQIRVVDVGPNQLNVRDTAGVIGTTVIFLADEDSIFNVVDGPQQADGLTWWKIQDPTNAARAGWAASNYLEAVPGG